MGEHTTCISINLRENPSLSPDMKEGTDKVLALDATFTVWPEAVLLLVDALNGYGYSIDVGSETGFDAFTKKLEEQAFKY